MEYILLSRKALRGVITLVFAQSVDGLENFRFNCSKIVKNTSHLKKSARTVTHECYKVNSE